MADTEGRPDSEATSPTRQRIRVREKRRRKSRARTGARIAVSVTFLVIILLMADGIYSAFKLASLPDVEESLRDAEEAIRDSRFEAAQTSLEEALREAESAESASRRPSMAIASVLPGIGNDADAVRALASAARLSSEAGLEFVRGIRSVDPDAQELMSSIYADGQIRFDAIERLKPYVSRAAGLIKEASDLVHRSPQARIAALDEALISAKEEMGVASGAAAKAAALLDTLPSLLGETERRRYLLAFQTPSEARGTGGLIGMYGVLQADGGQIELTNLAPVGDLAIPIEPVEAPDWYRDRYESLEALEQIQQTNFSPHFPVVADVVLQMYERIKGERLDGVFAMDPIALQSLTRATGPLSVKGFEQQVTPDNAAELLLFDSYVDFTREEQNVFLAGIIQQLWSKLSTGNVDAPVLADSIGEAVRGQHLKIYSRIEEDQEALVAMGAEGTFASHGPNVQMVFHGNYAASKIDWYLDRKQTTKVQLDSQGTARIVTTIELHNRATKDGPPLIVSGSIEKDDNVKGYPPGFNGMFLNFLLPENADVLDVQVNGEGAAYLLDEEFGFPVAWDLVELEAGEKATARVIYLLPNAADLDELEGLDLTLYPQALVRPDEFVFELDPPPGYEASFEGTYDDESTGVGIRTSGTLVDPIKIQTKLDTF